MDTNYVSRYDISLEERNCYLNEFCLGINENNMVESLYRWLGKSPRSKYGNEMMNKKIIL